MTSMAEALAQLNQTRNELLALLDTLDEATCEQPGLVGAWSVKQTLAHLASWEAWAAEALPIRLATGATPAHLAALLADEERFNAEEVAERAELTLDEQVMELERNRAELLMIIAKLSPEEQLRPHLWDTWPGTIPEYLLAAFRDHEAEHVAALRAALSPR